MELESCRDRIRIYEQAVARDQEQDEREKALAAREREILQRELDNEKRAVEIEKRRGDFYETMVRSLTKKPGPWCRFKRIFGSRCQ